MSPSCFSFLAPPLSLPPPPFSEIRNFSKRARSSVRDCLASKSCSRRRASFLPFSASNRACRSCSRGILLLLSPSIISPPLLLSPSIISPPPCCCSSSPSCVAIDWTTFANISVPPSCFLFSSLFSSTWVPPPPPPSSSSLSSLAHIMLLLLLLLALAVTCSSLSKNDDSGRRIGGEFGVLISAIITAAAAAAAALVLFL
mmetsp:Transcript_2549/g.3892  ORF Transcript_2549/g.3892 Transcript_2549/m.3892 type:complete len:200 (-) Transcript_2549:283-882(-)